jgi:hypothetical protein
MKRRMIFFESGSHGGSNGLAVCFPTRLLGYLTPRPHGHAIDQTIRP